MGDMETLAHARFDVPEPFVRLIRDESDPDVLYDFQAGPVLLIAGVPMHVWFVRVYENEDEEQYCPNSDYDHVVELLGGNGAVMTCRFPGVEGDWMPVVVPYGR